MDAEVAEVADENDDDVVEVTTSALIADVACWSCRILSKMVEGNTIIHLKITTLVKDPCSQYIAAGLRLIMYPNVSQEVREAACQFLASFAFSYEESLEWAPENVQRVSVNGFLDSRPMLLLVLRLVPTWGNPGVRFLLRHLESAVQANVPSTVHARAVVDAVNGGETLVTMLTTTPNLNPLVEAALVNTICALVTDRPAAVEAVLKHNGSALANHFVKMLRRPLAPSPSLLGKIRELVVSASCDVRVWLGTVGLVSAACELLVSPATVDDTLRFGPRKRVPTPNPSKITSGVVLQALSLLTKLFEGCPANAQIMSELPDVPRVIVSCMGVKVRESSGVLILFRYWMLDIQVLFVCCFVRRMLIQSIRPQPVRITFGSSLGFLPRACLRTRATKSRTRLWRRGCWRLAWPTSLQPVWIAGTRGPATAPQKRWQGICRRTLWFSAWMSRGTHRASSGTCCGITRCLPEPRSGNTTSFRFSPTLSLG